MSEGSRDPLCLALRLATLEQQWARAEPMPLIVDDILVGFDDARQAGCLDVLADLAQQNQIIVLSHHRRLVEQAPGHACRTGYPHPRTLDRSRRAQPRPLGGSFAGESGQWSGDPKGRHRPPSPCSRV